MLPLLAFKTRASSICFIIVNKRSCEHEILYSTHEYTYSNSKQLESSKGTKVKVCVVQTLRFYRFTYYESRQRHARDVGVERRTFIFQSNANANPLHTAFVYTRCVSRSVSGKECSSRNRLMHTWYMILVQYITTACIICCILTTAVNAALNYTPLVSVRNRGSRALLPHGIVKTFA